MNKTQTNHAIQNATRHMESIIEMMAALDNGGTVDGEELDSEQVQERIQESILDVEVRTDWHTPGDNDNKPTEYMILLSTGGPACRIVGELDEYCQPTTAKLEWQDWGTYWTRVYTEITDDDEEVLLQYAQCFYFGE